MGNQSVPIGASVLSTVRSLSAY